MPDWTPPDPLPGEAAGSGRGASSADPAPPDQHTPDERGPVSAAPAARAEAAQRAASDPAVSAFVAASAGSGKTKLLTDRLLRLMLEGAPPGRIQCLTFTRAAAAEMAVRLQTRLGEWVTLDDAALDARLRALAVEPTEAVRVQARRLFADVLDLPGGMRIDTIHAFCQSLLRRFPLEAALSPHFRLVEEVEIAAALGEARERLLGACPPEAAGALAALAGLIDAGQFGRIIEMLDGHREALREAFALDPAARAAALRRLVGVAAADDAALVAAAAKAPAEALADALRVAATRGADAVKRHAAAMLDWLAQPPAARAMRWQEWLELLLTGKGEKRATSKFCNPALLKDAPEICPAVEAEQDRVLAVEEQRAALRAAEATAALLTLAGPMLDDVARRKDRAGQLDHDDLIRLTSALLVDPGAAWVLYKLDGGIDHLLLDEVQDTARAQWEIAHALTEEFFAGEGAREGLLRTVFAVGDRKQSIYSFQGADPAQFDHFRRLWGARVRNAGQVWREVPLDVSFRSTAPVLALVDAVFADPEAAAGVVPDETLRHAAHRSAAPGRVELWPLTPREVATEVPGWSVPGRNLGLATPQQRLAEALADCIRAETDGTRPLAGRDRALAPGDVLVLVRRRDAFSRALVRALKAQGVPVAGLDRLTLTAQPAVQDLLALCDALLLPQDDLQLACVLTSPLGGLSDDSLMALAIDRPGTLWEALRRRHAERPDWDAAWQFFATLLRRADTVTPHALLAEALGPLGGRARLLARLGPEAAEPVDELLGAALADARDHPPALQGFLQRLRGAAAEIKRRPEGPAAGGGLVRVMTVHGAKGLQAPLVILPDTTGLPPGDVPLLWADDPETGRRLPLWNPRKALRCDASRRLLEAERRRQADEQNRLLYVALTRAEDRLVVCGVAPKRALPDACWYSLVARGFARLGAAEQDWPGAPWPGAPWPGAPWPGAPWPGALLVHETTPAAGASSPPETPQTEAADGAPVPPVPLPAWAGSAPLWRPAPPPPEPALPVPLAPSRPEGIAFGAVPQAASPAADDAGVRARRGALIHALLQHLPTLPPAAREAAAIAYAARPGHGLDAGAAREAAVEVLAILAHPGLAPLFGPAGRAELALTGLAGGNVVVGRVDRLAVLPDAVLVADFKTGRAAPRRIADTPVLYLRQMAAYRAVLEGLYPDRVVRCALVWTQDARVDMLPDDLLSRHAPGARPPGPA